mmetsp:Transcript_5533/g.10167  ORF Transcript_5533/g.10167 Transcript_5533/m.10167 type:complete len:185 (-) Transcript_5533:185-739(-)
MGAMFSGLVFRPPKPTYALGDGRDYVQLGDKQGIAINLDYGYETTVLFLHGNSEDAGMVARYLEATLCPKLKVNAFIPEFPGYGILPGPASESGVFQAADSAYSYLTETLGIDSMNIVIYGRSLGTSPAIHLASVSKKTTKSIIPSSSNATASQASSSSAAASPPRPSPSKSSSSSSSSASAWI